MSSCVRSRYDGNAPITKRTVDISCAVVRINFTGRAFDKTGINGASLSLPPTLHSSGESDRA